MQPSLPLITIGITCHNASATIERAILSALSQDWPNLEVVIVDDASTDHSVSIVQSLAREASQLRLVQHARNKGVGAARNSTLREAKGEYIAFFDDDDYSFPDRVTSQYERIRAYQQAVHTDLVACFTARRQLYPNGRQHYEPTLGMDITPSPSGRPVAELILLGKPLPGSHGSCASCSMMASRQVFECMNGFDTKLRREEDTDFNLRFAMLGGHFAGIAEPLVTQTMTFSQDKDFEEERRNALYLLNKRRDYLKELSWFDFLTRWVNLKFDYLAGKRISFVWGFLALMIRFPVKSLWRLYWARPNLGQYQRFKRGAKARKPNGDMEERR